MEEGPLSDGPVLDELIPKGQLLTLSILSCLGMALFGYDTGVVSGAIIQIVDDFTLSRGQEEVVVSSTVLFAAVGAAIGGSMTKKYGRKPLIQLASLLYIAGALTVALSTTFIQLVAGRVVLGTAIGITSMTVPVYVAECAPSNIRGTLVTMNDLMIVIGQVVAGISNGLLQNTPSGWRWTMGAAFVPALMQSIGFLTLPESPRFLIQKGHTNRAQEALLELRGPRSDWREEMRQIEQALQNEESLSEMQQLRALLSVPKYRRALSLSVGLLAMNQLTAINTVMYYGATIMEKAGFSKDAAVWLSAGCNLAQACGVAYCISQMDKTGRRDLALRSSTLVFLALILLSLSFLEDPPIPWISMPLVMFYLISFGSGLSGVPWAINSEVFPLAVRGVGSGLSIGCSWICNFLVSLTFLDLCKYMTTTGAFGLYAGVAAVGTYVIYKAMPETMGLTLEQIEVVFSRPLWGCHRRGHAEQGDGTQQDGSAISAEEGEEAKLLAAEITKYELANPRAPKAPWPPTSILRGGSYNKLAD